jgi:hypothetical protein
VGAYDLLDRVVRSPSLSVELFKLYHTPALDAFRLTLPGKLLLGRVFSLWDLIAYAVGVIVGVFASHAIGSRPANRAC